MAAHEHDVEELEVQSEFHHLFDSEGDKNQSQLSGAAYQLQCLVQNVKTCLSSPLTVSELSLEEVENFVPNTLYNFLTAVVDSTILHASPQLDQDKVTVSSE